MLCLCLYQVFVLIFPWMISWNSVTSFQKLTKRQAVNLCPNNKWKEHNGMCFLQVENATTFWEARKRCRNKFVGSEVAKIRSRDDLNFIENSIGSDIHWIGITQKSGTRWRGELVWEDGSNGTFVNFAPGEPTNLGDEDCILLDGIGRYWDGKCDEKYWSLCSIPASVDHCKTKNVRCHENAQCYSTFLTFVCLCNDSFAGDGVSSCKTSYGCPSAEWKEHKGLCYIEESKTLTYLAARRNCKSKYAGSSLAKFRYEGDRIFLQNSFKFSGYRWLGLRRTTSWRDELTWDDKSNVTYKSYNLTEPNDRIGHQFCIITNNKGQWFVEFCDRLHGSFCSIDASQGRDDRNTTTVKPTINVCPNKKWKEHNGMCFLAVKTLDAHWKSRNRCSNKHFGSYLVKIRSSDDLKFLVDSFEFTTPHWVGLNQKSGTHWRGELVWFDGSNGTFINFAPGEPTNRDSEDCISMHEGGVYYDEKCDEKYWSICSIPARVDLCKTKNIRCHENAKCYSTFLTFVCLCNDGFAGDGITSCNKSDGCPDAQWKEHKGLCYIEYSEESTYDGARHNCRSKYNGSSLAKFRYEGDQSFLVNSFKFSGFRWIGLRTRSKVRTWDDESFFTYISFAITEPDFYDGRQWCYFTDSNGEWHDNFCDTYHGLFCSIKSLDSGIAVTSKPVKTTLVKTTLVSTTTVKTTAVKTTAFKTTTIKVATFETTTVANTTAIKGTPSAFSRETGIMLAVAVAGCLILLVVAFFGYKRFRSQRNQKKIKENPKK